MEWQYFLHKHLFQLKRGQKRAKRPNKIVEASQREIRPKKAKRPTKIFRPNNLKRGQFQTFGLKNASLATLGHYAAR